MIEKIQKIFELEAQAIRNIPITDCFEKAVATILAAKGKIITTGIGKCGYIAQKAASTFSTTGSPSIFLHPGDATHGDVGVVGANDILLAYSNSGKTREVLETAHFSKSLNVSCLISISSTSHSPLAEMSDIVIEIGQIKEVCPFGLTPTSSIIAMLAVSDALALIAMEQRGFTKDQFALRHHGGYLGEKCRSELNN